MSESALISIPAGALLIELADAAGAGAAALLIEALLLEAAGTGAIVAVAGPAAVPARHADDCEAMRRGRAELCGCGRGAAGTNDGGDERRDEEPREAVRALRGAAVADDAARLVSALQLRLGQRAGIL